MTNVKDYTFLMLDGNGNSTAVNVDELFQKYLSTLTIPSVEFYASSEGTQPLKKSYNKIEVFKNEIESSTNVKWNDLDKSLEILKDGKYLLTLQVGVRLEKSTLLRLSTVEDVRKAGSGSTQVMTKSILEEDMLVGFTNRFPSDPNDKDGLWIGRGVFRMNLSAAGSTRNFTSYSTLLKLKKGDKVYPMIFINDAYEDGNVILEGVQKGDAGDGILTNFSVTKY